MNVFEDKTVFSRRLREEMVRTGNRHIDIAKKTGIPISTISRYVSGEILPRIEYANRIAQVLDVEPMYLFGYEEETNKNYKYCPWCGKEL